MRFSLAAAVAALSAVSQTTAFSIDEWDVMAGQSLVNQVLYQFTKPQVTSSTCTPLNAAVRREWGALSLKERKEYTDAVKCLATKPSKSGDFAPGAKNRFDDFVAVHINQTMFIHATGNFLAWHRYYTWAYEQALRNECGYKGYQPYWSWGKYNDDPLNSPVFDGSAYSMSGDGAYVEHGPIEAAPGISLNPGNGGGCIMSGPFTNWTVNLGPLAPTLNIAAIHVQNGTGLEYNPRCLRRDINKQAASWTSTEEITDLLTNYKDIVSFQNHLQGDFPNGYLGIHSGGHYTIGGDPGGDFFASPGDPAFYLHHSAIDRLWWTWQNQNPTKRTFVAEGPAIIPGIFPNTPNITINDMQYLGTLAPPKTIKELLDTTGGPFCYVYL